MIDAANFASGRRNTTYRRRLVEAWTHRVPPRGPLLVPAPLCVCCSTLAPFFCRLRVFLFVPIVVFLLYLVIFVGGTKDCDHWHQGAGFVTSHMALTLMFEQAVQAVNPAVSMPYWDFTLESTFFGAADFRTSGVFADDWFGAASTDNVREPSPVMVAVVVCSG